MTHSFTILWLAASISIGTADGSADNTHQSYQVCMNSVSQKPFDDQPCLDLLTASASSDQNSVSGLVTNEAASRGGTIARAHAILAAGYAANGELVTADRHLDQALELAPLDWNILANAGVVHLHNTRFADAVDTLSQAMSSNPDFPPYLLLNRSLALRGLGRFVESARDVDDYRYLTGRTPPGASACDPIVENCNPEPAFETHRDR